MTRLLIPLLLALTAFGQPMISNAPPSERKMVEVKNLRGPRLDQAVRLLNDFMSPGDAKMYPDLNAVLLRGTTESIAGGEALLKKFDVQQPASAATHAQQVAQSYQLRIYFVEALSGEESKSSIPAEISPAIEQMRKSLVYKGYRVLDTALLQTEARARGAQLSGILPMGSIRQPATYQISLNEVVPIEEGRALQLHKFNAVLRFPVAVSETNVQMYESVLATDLTVRVGQKLVVGKLSRDNTASAIFLIVTAEPIS